MQHDAGIDAAAARAHDKPVEGGETHRRVDAAPALHCAQAGAVAEVRVAPGDTVAAGDTLVVLEAMKLLQSLPAPVAGVVAEIYCAPGDTVAGHAPLVKLDPEEQT